MVFDYCDGDANGGISFPAMAHCHPGPLLYELEMARMQEHIHPVCATDGGCQPGEFCSWHCYEGTCEPQAMAGVCQSCDYCHDGMMDAIEGHCGACGATTT